MLPSTPSVERQDAPANVGRYRLDARIGRGGMAEVFRAEDLGRGCAVALKRLLPEHAGGRLARMFEREYHTLAGLAHPRIIEVYEYGLEGGVPYYTMELLGGKDLRELAPLSYRTACRHLHDVASSLALLHARRLLHRDLSARNVRVTADERCKLIDFGALASFGRCDAVVGTPPLVPPEALHGAALDQRADLYSLGALAYWLLTGRHAFAVTALSHLPAAWRTPPPRPSQMIEAREASGRALEPIPPALDELVMALLTPDPLARPSTAAEVIDRLLAIAELAPDREPLSSQSYLRRPALVGRERELERIDSRIRALPARSGNAVTIETTQGMGASRLLSEIALRGQLAGATPLLIDAKLQRGPYGVIHELIDKLLQAAPAEATAAAAAHGPALARFSPRLRAELAVPADDTNLTGIPGELRRRTQSALIEWLLALADRRPLLLLVDDLQLADEGSLALLAGLAHAAAHHPLLIVGAHQLNENAPHAAVLKAIAAAGTSMRLRPLQKEQVRALVRSLFGDVPHAGRLGDWIHGLSGGQPQACMELASDLVERGIVRYADGTWLLPQELAPSELPASLEQLFATRLARLSGPARRLAEALSVRDGTLALSRCLEIARAQAVDPVYAVIDELVREGVLVQSGESYHFGHESVRALLLRRIEPERLRRLHVQLGALLSLHHGGDVHAMLDAGFHLLHGGREAEGAQLLARAGIALGYISDEMPAAVAPLTAALAVFRRQHRPAYELVQLLGPLTLAGYYCDRRLAEQFGDETIDLLTRLLGLRLAVRLRPVLGRKLGLYAGLGVAALRFLRPGRGGIAGLRRTITLLVNCVTCLVAAATICFQRERAQRFVAAIEPLTALGDDHAGTWTYRFTALLATIPEDRQAHTIAGLTELLARLEDPRPIRDMPADSRQMMLGGCLYALGALEAFRAGHKARDYAERLECLGVRLYTMVAAQVRANYHALRGEADLARAERERVEMYALQSGSGWQVEIWAPCSMILAQMLHRDRLGLKHTMENLDRLSADVPSLERHAKLARAAYYALKGELRLAEALRRSVLDSVAPRGLVGWASTVASQGQTLRGLGETARAKKLVAAAAAQLDAEDRRVVVMTHGVFVELALCHADDGDLVTAARMLDALLAEHADCDGPLVLGNLHGARAKVALRAGDVPTARLELLEMERHYRPTGNPCLIAQCEQLRRELGRGGESDAQAAPSLHPREGDARADARAAEALLRACPNARERNDRALALLLEHAGGRAGYLFTWKRERLLRAAPEHGAEPPPELEAHVASAIASYTLEESTARTAPSSASSQLSADSAAGHGHRVYVLACERDGRDCVFGAVAIARQAGTPRALHPRLLRAVADALTEPGPSVVA